MDFKQEVLSMTGIAAADQTFYRSPKNSVRQVANIQAASNAATIDISSVDYTQSGAPFVVWCGGAGAVKIDTINGDTVTIAAVPAGVRVGGDAGIVCTKVYKTGTAATSMVALN